MLSLHQFVAQVNILSLLAESSLRSGQPEPRTSKLKSRRFAAGRRTTRRSSNGAARGKAPRTAPADLCNLLSPPPALLPEAAAGGSGAAMIGAVMIGAVWQWSTWSSCGWSTSGSIFVVAQSQMRGVWIQVPTLCMSVLVHAPPPQTSRSLTAV